MTFELEKKKKERKRENEWETLNISILVIRPVDSIVRFAVYATQ